MNLPLDFVNKINDLLQQDAEKFFSSYKEGKVSGLRINPLKIFKDKFLNIAPWDLESVPFCPTGFYYHAEDQPGKHPFHHAGLYYIQEPSAMLVAEVVAPKSDEKVLDLCAAPGGKSTHLAALMNNSGLLISNEIHPKRVKALSENIERLGVTNCVVTNESPERLAVKFPGYFDKILVDAPCSGEGMFRKDPEAMQYWNCDYVSHCASMQRDILESAYLMLKEGGILVYSTCTFSPEENEQSIEAFLERHPDFKLLPIEKNFGIEPGMVQWTKHHTETIVNTARLWPHRLKGEGHFVAKMLKTGATPTWQGKPATANATKEQIKFYQEFETKFLNITIDQPIIAFKDQLYALPNDCPPLVGLKIVRSGLHLGTLKKNRFEPNHALAMALKQQEIKNTFDLSMEEDLWKKYIKGETLPADDDRGWIVVTMAGFSLGWGKEVKGTVKNFYPKGLRKG
ncbi:RsmB/NOP family class I SAM-dependent RNA methyltransferase [Peptococcaceae bacterium 1198_IL3148]